MNKFTPGPWYIHEELAMQDEGLGQDEITDELLSEDEYQIYAGTPSECTRSSLRGYFAHVCDIDASDFDDEDEGECRETALANARLITAAPDMYEALSGVAAMSRCGQLDCFISEPWLNAVFAAIKKADGETE